MCDGSLALATGTGTDKWNHGPLLSAHWQRAGKFDGHGTLLDAARDPDRPSPLDSKQDQVHTHYRLRISTSRPLALQRKIVSRK